MTAPRPNRLAIFDCDGTLVDSQASICAAMADCFATAGLADPGAEAARRVVGLSLVEAVARLHPTGDAALHGKMARDYKAAFQRHRGAGLVAEPLYDGVFDAIARIAEAGWLLGVATGKSDRGLGFVLSHHGLTDRFITLQTADRHPSKPHPSMVLQAMAEAGAAPETTVVIGDTSFDIAMAKAAGATAIGVAWGYHTPAELIAEGADHVVDRAADLPALLERLA